MDTPSFAKILDPQVSVRGAKYALISTNKHGDNKLRLTIGDKIIPTSTPFGVSTFNNDDATRKNIEFVVCPSVEVKINAIYNWALEHLASKSESFFKKPVSKLNCKNCSSIQSLKRKNTNLA